VKTIIVLPGTSPPESCFPEVVRTLFPECEVVVVLDMAEALARLQPDSFSGLADMEPVGRA